MSAANDQAKVKGGRLTRRPLSVGSLVGRVLLDDFLDLIDDGVDVERCRRLLRWEVDEGLGELADNLLHVDEAPELVEVEVLECGRHILDTERALERVDLEVDDAGRSGVEDGPGEGVDALALDHEVVLEVIQP